MTLHAPNGRYINDARMAEAVAQMFTRIGVETKVETMPPAVFFKRASAGAEGNPEFSFILVGWGAGTGEVSSPLKSLVATFDKAKGMGTANRGRYSNPELDKAIDEALATVDDDKRGRAAGEGQRDRHRRRGRHRQPLPAQHVGDAEGSQVRAAHRRVHDRHRA